MIRNCLYFCLLAPALLSAQSTCTVSNLWQNGNFEATDLKCLVVNSKNTLSNPNAPWYGYAMFRWQPKTEVQPSYLNEADFDHTLGTDNGYYYYLDPRPKSGWDYEFQQEIQVEKNNGYFFSMWYCSMNKPGKQEATIRLTVNGTVVASQVTIPNVNNSWVQIKGFWNSGSATKAVAALQTYNAAIDGMDFAIDDVVFGPGKLVVNAGRDTTYCSSTSVTLGLTRVAQYGVSCDNTYKYVWEPASGFSSSNLISTPRLKNPIQQGYYKVTVTDYNGNVCSDSVKITVSSDSAVNKKLFTDSAFCLPLNWTVKLPNKYTIDRWDDGSKALTRTYTDTGNYVVFFNEGCNKYFDTISITAKPTAPIFDLKDTAVCPGESVIYSVQDVALGFAVLWSDGDTAKQKTIDQTGKYWVKISSECDSFTDTLNVKAINELPVILIPDIYLCNNEDTVLKIPYYYQNITWSDADTSHVKRINNTGKYSYYVQGICTYLSDSFYVTIGSPVVFDLGENDTICFTNPIELRGPVGYAYKWGQGQASQSIMVSSPGVYVLTIKDVYGCTAIDSIEYFGADKSLEMYIPNAFTPDENGLNEYFPANTVSIPARLQVYNRWGERVFDSKTAPIWNGFVGNKPAQEGVYAWIFTYKNCRNYPVVKKGNVLILR